MLLMSLATLLAFDLQVLMCCPRPLPLVITASSAKVGFSQGNTWGVTRITLELEYLVKIRKLQQWCLCELRLEGIKGLLL
jgi:hypothetical protein